MADERLNSIVNQLISSSDPEEVRQLYRQWSSSYDQDLESFGYVALFTCRELYFDEVAATLTKIHQGKGISASTIIFDDYMVGQGASAYYVGLTKSVE